MSEIDLNSPEVKAAIKAAIDEATSGLIAKRDELLGEVKKLRKGQEISPDDYQKLKDENDDLNDKLVEANKSIKLVTSEIEKERKAKEGESKFVQQLLIENGLTEALQKANVKPELAKAAKALFAGQAQIKIDGENRSALIGDKAIADYIGEWAKSDEGKHFVLAPINGGGDASGGGNNKPVAKTATRAEFEAFAPTQKMEFSKTGGTITE